MRNLREICEPHVQDAGNVKEGVARFSKFFVNEIMTDERFRPEEASIREIFNETTLREHPDIDVNTIGVSDLSEAIGHSWFPYITKELINKELLPAYEYSLNGIDELVSTMTTTRTDFDYIAGITAMTRMPRVYPGQNYPNAEIGEKRVRVELAKFGEILNLEKELVLGDQTGKVLDRARNAGQAMGDHRHRFIAETITDQARDALGESSSTALYYDGSARTIYANDHSTEFGYANDNLSASTDINDSADLNKVMELLGTMQDEKGRYITVIPRQILVHPRQFEYAWNISSSKTDPFTANRAENYWKQYVGLKPYQTPYVSTNTDFFVGDFPKQFVWMWVWKPKVDREGANSTASFERDVVARFKYHYSGSCAARDARFCVKATA